MRLWFIACAGLLVAACSTRTPAPVVDRSVPPDVRPAPSAPAAGPSAGPVAREAKDGTYVVQRGDTLYSIALDFGLDYRELARRNGISDVNSLRVGQTLRLAAPSGEDAVATTAPIAPSSGVETRPLGPPVVAPPAAVPVAPVAPPAAAAKPPAPLVADSIVWQWPAAGKVIEVFEEPRSKGIDIAGSEGDAVNAAADGEVVYVGSTLRGYGNLVIVKHSDDLISAYAYNKQVLVKQGELVKRGQRIADLGKSDTDRPKLHFEIRRQGKPVDPQKFLPPR